jgi:hypothetical protein
MCLAVSSASVALKRRAMDPVYTVKIFPVYLDPPVKAPVHIVKFRPKLNLAEKDPS